MNLLRSGFLATSLLLTEPIEPIQEIRCESESASANTEIEACMTHTSRSSRRAARIWQRNLKEASKPSFEKVHVEEAFFARYGLEIFKTIEEAADYGRKIVPYRGTKCAFERDMLALKSQLAKWPPEIFKKLELNELIWSDHMESEDGWSVGMMPQYGHVFYLSRSWPLSHEIFHRIDHLLGGGNVENPSGVMWIEITRPEDDQKWYSLDHPSAVNPSRIGESQAEYCRMLMNLDNPLVLNKQYLPLMKYPGPRDKFELMKQWLFEFSDGLMDHQFFVDLREGRVDENYWGQRSGKSGR